MLMGSLCVLTSPALLLASVENTAFTFQITVKVVFVCLEQQTYLVQQWVIILTPRLKTASF